MDLQSILNGVLSNGSATQAISDKTGLNKDQVSQAIAVGLPAILGGMEKNAQTSDGANALNSALNDHVNSPVIADPSQAATDDVQTDGGNILGHVFGQGTDSIYGAIANKIGADPKQVQSALAILAPIAIGYLAKHKSQNNLDATGVATSLNQTQAASGSPVASMLEGMLGNVLRSKL